MALFEINGWGGRRIFLNKCARILLLKPTNLECWLGSYNALIMSTTRRF